MAGQRDKIFEIESGGFGVLWAWGKKVVMVRRQSFVVGWRELPQLGSQAMDALLRFAWSRQGS